MVLDAVPRALAVAAIAAVGALSSSRWRGAGRLGLVLAVFVGLLGVESPPWPPVSAGQHLPFVLPVALGLLGMGPRTRPAALGTGVLAALAGAVLLRRVFARDPLEGLLWCTALLVATSLGSRGLPAGRRGLAWTASLAAAGAAAIGSTGSAYLSLDAGVIALATAALCLHAPATPALARGALGGLAVVLLLAMRLSSLPVWAGLGLMLAAGLPGLLLRRSPPGPA